jgi:hypothetical protein
MYAQWDDEKSEQVRRALQLAKRGADGAAKSAEASFQKVEAGQLLRDAPVSVRQLGFAANGVAPSATPSPLDAAVPAGRAGALPRAVRRVARVERRRGARVGGVAGALRGRQRRAGAVGVVARRRAPAPHCRRSSAASASRSLRRCVCATNWFACCCWRATRRCFAAPTSCSGR